MAKPEQFTAQQMIAALTETKGMATLAAKKLGCSANTVRRYIREYPTVAQAHEDARETTLDAVELKLYDNIMRGDTTAAIFYLKTQGKKRGYVERLELDFDLGTITELVKALRAIGENEQDVFTRLIEAAKQRVRADSG